MISKFLFYSKKYSLLLLILIPISSIIEISVAALLQLLTNVATGKTTIAYSSVIFLVLSYIIIDSIFYFLKSFTQEKWLNEICSGVRANLIKEYLYSQTPSKINSKENDRFNQLTNNMEIFQNDYLRSFINIFAQLCQFIIAVVMSIFIQPALCVIVIFLCIPGIIIPMFNQRILKASKNKVLQSSQKYTIILRNILDGLRTIQMFNVNNIMNHLFEKANLNWLKRQNQDQKKRKIIGSVSQFLDSFLYLGTWVGGLYFVMNKSISLGQLIAFSQLMIFIAEPLQSASGLLTDFIGSKDIAKQINSNLYLGNNHPEQNLKIDQINSIEYKNVNYQIGNKRILTNINLTFKKDRHYLLVGKTGSGKTSILTLPLLNEKNEAQQGIKINGKNLLTIDKKSLHDHLGIAEQNAYIFSSSLKNNITLFRNSFSQNKINTVLSQVELSSYIGENAQAKEISNSGSEISGGEAKRMFIGRALLPHFDYLLFDEPSSGLDPKTADNIENMLMNLKVGWSAITHRYNEKLFNYVDSIIVIDNGKVVANGKLNNIDVQKWLTKLNLITN